MVGYVEYKKRYNLFYPSSQKKIIERSVQFEEEPMQEIKLVKGDCSHPPLNDDVRDDYFFDFYDYDMEYDYDDTHVDHESPIRTKWVEKTIQAAGDFAGDPLDSRKTRSQFHNDFSTCDLNIQERCFMMVGFDTYSYE